jgi:transcriptional regulator with XRE-family HTH domain
MYCSPVEHDPDWPIEMTARIGERVARLRAEREMTVQALADRCAELGVPLGRVTLTKLEGGKRQAVTPAELTVLAAALGAAPIELLYPVGYEKQVEVLPGRMVDPLDAVRWFAGELAMDATADATNLKIPPVGKESGTYLLQQHRDYIEKVEVADGQAALALASAAEPAAGEYANQTASYRLQAADDWRMFVREPLRRIRAEMRRRKMLLPDLPASVETDEDGGSE